MAVLLFSPLVSQAHDTRKLSRAIEDTREAVVKIVVSKTVRAQSEEHKTINQSFKNNFPEIFSRGSHSRFTGSGLIVETLNNQTALIVSSAHLLKDAKNIRVEFADGEFVKARILGVDRASDIALLKIPLSKRIKLPQAAALEMIYVGQPVYAIGAPFGFSGSVTAGIVSALREGPGLLQNNEVIQTDVAVNPGNSGGPLFNFDGEVIGITTQIMSTNGGFQGVSFALAMQSVIQVITRIKRTADTDSYETDNVMEQ